MILMEVKQMLLMYSDEVVAYQDEIDGQPVMIKRPNIEDWKFPFMLFGDKSYISVFKFSDWVCERCFPPERVDARKLLDELGLEHYDRWEIVKKTSALMPGRDQFWVDFTK